MKTTLSIKAVRLARIVAMWIAAFGCATTLARGAAVAWTGDTEIDPNWETDTNWSGGDVPTLDDSATIDAGSSAEAPVLASSEGLAASQIHLGSEVGSYGALTVAGGTLNVSGLSRIGGEGEGLLEVAGGSVTNASYIYVGDAAAGTGTLRISGGSLHGLQRVYIGNNGRGSAVVDGGTLATLGNDRDIHVGRNLNSEGSLIVSNGTLSSSYAIWVGENGLGTFTQTGGTVYMARQWYIGNAATATGLVHLAGGTANVNYDCYFGRSGYAHVRIDDGVTFTPNRRFTCGVYSSGVGILEAGAATVTGGPGTYGYIVGNAGHGEIHMQGTDFRTDRVGVRVRLSEDSYGLVRGWGSWTASSSRINAPGILDNNGLIIADGYGEERDMSFATYTRAASDTVTNTIENVSTNGWYAVNKGRLILGAMTAAVGSGVVLNWGEAPDDAEIDLVNSLRFEFGEVTTSGALTGSLLAADRSDVPAPPSGKALIGVWNVTFTGSFTTLDLQARYDHAAAGGAAVSLLRYNTATSAWVEIGNTVLSGYRVAAAGIAPQGDSRIGLIAAAYALPTPPTLILLK